MLMDAVSNDICVVAARAVDIAQTAGQVAMGYFRRPFDVQVKSDDSPVTIADQTTEQFIRARLQVDFPLDGIMGEEFGIQTGQNDALWVTDPIDGTRSFITGHPLFGLLLGRLMGGMPQIGVVQMPFLRETYCGIAGRGATLNGHAIKVRQVGALSDAMIYINEAEKIFAADQGRFARLCTIGHTRRMGYDCYSYALLAAGHIDGVVDCGLQPYDYLPLIGLVEAAGGIMTDWQGNPLTSGSDGRVVCAATAPLHQALLKVLAA